MHDGIPYGRNQGQGQGHSREVDRQSPTGLIFYITFYKLYFSPICPEDPTWTIFHQIWFDGLPH